MEDRPVKRCTGQPARLTYVEAVVAVCEVVIDLVSVSDLKNVQDEDIDNKLRQDDNRCEGYIVLQVILANLIVLGNLCLVGEKHDKVKRERNQEKSLRLTGIGVYGAEKCLQAFAFLSLELETMLIFTVSVLSNHLFLVVLIQTHKLQLRGQLLGQNCVQALAAEDET